MTLRVLARLIRDDEGQDLVEYGLLAAIFGVLGLLAFPAIEGKMGDLLGDWNQGVYNNWIPDDPIE